MKALGLPSMSALLLPVGGRTCVGPSAGKLLTRAVPGAVVMAGGLIPVWEAAAKASSPLAFSLASLAWPARVLSPSKPVTGSMSPC